MRHGCGNNDLRWAWRLANKFGPGGPFGPFGPFGPAGPFGPGGPFGGGRGWRGGPRHGRRRMFDRGELRLVLLKLIAEEPRHGYDLIKAIEELSGRVYSPSPGVIYPALAMLADEGLIVERESEPGQRRPVVFAITEAGQAVLDEEAEAAAEAYERLVELGERAERGREPSIERASVNLFTAVAQRIRVGDEGEDDLAHRIAAILDEAAQKIERL